MKYDAIIFDLFGTLVDNMGGQFVECLRREGLLTDLVGARQDEFGTLWDSDEMFLKRITGVHRESTDCVTHICSLMGIEPDQKHMGRVHQCRMEYIRDAIGLRSDVMPTLARLRQQGLKLALMTVCAWETLHCWQACEAAGLFDVAVFSCVEGLNKPDSRLYERTCERLGTEPQRCLYVGDAGGDELMGARRCGMEAILMCAPHEEHIVMQRNEARNWNGPRISAIGQLPGLIGADGERKAMS